MGSAHNLFGATNVVYVKADLDNVGGGGGKRGNYVIEKVKWGDTMRDILGTKQGWGADDLLHEFHKNVNDCVSSGYVTQAAAQAFVAYFQTCLNSYTYLT
jgi:arginine decarboxylase-like protein